MELTGFDVEGHVIGAKLIGSATDNLDVGDDLDLERALDALLGLFLRRLLQDLAEGHTQSKAKKKTQKKSSVYPEAI